jgi:hypothetical protein
LNHGEFAEGVAPDEVGDQQIQSEGAALVERTPNETQRDTGMEPTEWRDASTWHV